MVIFHSYFGLQATGDRLCHPSPILQVLGSQGEASFLLALLEALKNLVWCALER